MLKRFVLTVTSLVVSLVIPGMMLSAHAKDIDEGIEYQLITPPVRPANENKIEVVEMFWYGCPHCYAFEAKLNAWKKKLPENVEFIRIPAVFAQRRGWE